MQNHLETELISPNPALFDNNHCDTRTFMSIRVVRERVCEWEREWERERERKRGKMRAGERKRRKMREGEREEKWERERQSSCVLVYLREEREKRK